MLDLSDSTWTQASLPVHSGGLGIRSTVQLAPSAFLASAAVCSDLIHQILLERLSGVKCTFQDDALDMWSQSHKALPPEGIESFRQISWDTPLVQATAAKWCSARSFLDTFACCGTERIWCLAQCCPSNITRFKDEWQGSQNCSRIEDRCTPSSIPHMLPLWWTGWCYGTHGLSCRRSQDRYPRHTSLNAVVKRRLDSAKIRSWLKTNGLLRSDGKQPDGMFGPMEVQSIISVGCHIHLCSLAGVDAGNVATKAEYHKRTKYHELDSVYLFVPLAIETSGAFGPAAAALFLLIWTNRSQPSWRNPWYTPFCISV